MANRYKSQEKYLGKLNQKKIQNASALIVGVGALGSNCANLLVRAGIGTLTILDFDIVSLDNLQRQTIYDQKCINKLKVSSLKQKLEKINSQTKIISKKIKLDKKNIQRMDLKVDLILDCTDNINTKLLLNEFSKKTDIPLIFGSCAGSSGYIYISNNGACLNCFLDKKMNGLNSANYGILNTTAATIAALQTNEAIKIICKKKYEENLLKIDLQTNTILKIKTKKNLACKICSKNKLD